MNTILARHEDGSLGTRTSDVINNDDFVKRRDRGHKDKDAQGFGPAKVFLGLPASVKGGYRQRLSDPSYWAIRGVEQMRIDKWQSLGKSANKINGISPTNPQIQNFLNEAAKYLK